MKIRIFDNEGKTADRYTVFIENIKNGEMLGFDMSSDANMPNGVNMYNNIEFEKFISLYDNRISELTQRCAIPVGLLLAIVGRIQQIGENS